MPSPDDHDPVGRALSVIRAGGLVGMPTETVYGLAADAANDHAVQRIFRTKGRPDHHPLIVHLGSAEQMLDWAKNVPAAAVRLADTCWPGPLTVLVPKADTVSDVVTGGRDTVGLRVPAHPMALDLLRRFGGGLAAPSANKFGQVSPTTAAHVASDLGSAVDFVLDGGPCPIGVESTIVDCTVSPAQILRPGGIPNEAIAELLDGLGGVDGRGDDLGPSRASGMLSSHYAPRCRVEIVETISSADQRAESLRALGQHVDVIDPSSDLTLAAHQLYVWLRNADERGIDTVVAVMPPPRGLGHAIRDRLRKAAGKG